MRKMCTLLGVSATLLLANAALANDNCATPTIVAAGATPFDNTGATDDGTDAACAFPTAGVPQDDLDLYFRYTAPAGVSTINVNTCAGPTGDTTLVILDTCGGTQLACNDDSCGLRSAINSFPVTPGTTYLIRVASWRGTGAAVPVNGILTISEGTGGGNPGETCAGAIVQNGPTASPLLFDTSAYVSEGTNPCGGSGPDIFYSYTAAVTGSTTISTCGSSFDTTLQAYDACGGAPVGPCSDDACGLSSQTSFLATAGVSYIIQVDGFGGGFGPGQLTITETPAVAVANDTCATASAAVAGSNTFDNTFATADGGVASCIFVGGTDGNDVWFRYTAPAAPATQFVQFDTLGSIALDDTTLSIFDECGGTEIACNDDAGTGLLSRTVLEVTAGEDYFVRVASFDGSTLGAGDLQITEGVSPPPANDLCANAIQINGSTTSPITFDTVLASSEGTNPCGGSGPDIFYRYTASVTGTALVSLCGSSFDTTLQAYDGCGGTAVGGCSDDSCGAQSEITICVTQGQSYILQVDGFGGSSGPGQIAITETAGGGTVANDDCSGAIAAVVGSNAFDNNCATGGPGPGTCAFNGSDGADVWFSFVADSTCYTFDTLASTVIGDTTIQLFDSCSANTAIGCNDDSDAGLLSSLTASGLSPGTTYFIRVAGWGVAPDRGAGVLTITDLGSCPCDQYVAAPANALAEGEECGSDTNGGCNATPEAFRAITCGDTIAGNSWKDFDIQGLRDTDWYEFTITSTSDVTIKGRSQFEPQVALLNNDCTAIVQIAVAPPRLAGCANFSVVANDLAAGTYRVFVGMAVAQPDTLCGSGANDYWLSLQVSDATPGVCDIDFNNNCVFPEDADVIDFFNVLAGAECLSCDSIDFNRNSVFPEDQDVIDFFNVLAGAPCPY